LKSASRSGSDARPLASEIIARLRASGRPRAKEELARFGIRSSTEVLGLSIPQLRQIARPHRHHHALALELWSSGIHDARVLATLVDDPPQITRGQMERWVRDCDNWALTDACAFLFDRTEFAAEKARAWSARRAEFVKRTGFALMAGMAVHRSRR
jgi:3-methyladenine DNA glycosylase AlkD